MEKSLKQFEVLKWASSFLKLHDREEGIAEILLEHHLQMNRAAFYANMQNEIPAAVFADFKTDIVKHAETGMPVQRILGSAPFYGREFSVNEHVLIPRFETEELVETVSKSISKQGNKKGLTVADIGTGSGVIAITLKLLFPETRVIAIDISYQALQIAKQNAAVHHADVEFLEGDFLMPLLNQDIIPDIIVSNPPYIKYSDKEMLKDTVKNYDPELALFAEDDGLSAYKTIVSQAHAFKDPVKKIFFEIGYDQAEAVMDIIHTAFPDKKLSVQKDINKNDRIVKMDSE